MSILKLTIRRYLCSAQSFLGQFCPGVMSTSNLQTNDGGSDPQGTISEAGFEANIDIQYTVGVATDVPINFVSMESDSIDRIDGFLDIVK